MRDTAQTDSPPARRSPNPDTRPSSLLTTGPAGGAFSTSVAPTSNGGIGQSGSEPGTTTDTYNCDRRYLAGLRPMWLESAINLRAAWRRP